MERYSPDVNFIKDFDVSTEELQYIKSAVGPLIAIRNDKLNFHSIKHNGKRYEIKAAEKINSGSDECLELDDEAYVEFFIRDQILHGEEGKIPHCMHFFKGINLYDALIKYDEFDQALSMKYPT